MGEEIVLAHFNEEEIFEMNKIQGGEDFIQVDDGSTLPYFGKLWAVFNAKPEIKPLIAEAFERLLTLPEKKAKSTLKKLESFNNNIFKSQSNNQSGPGSLNQNEELIQDLGKNGDTILAALPKGLLEFFLSLVPDEVNLDQMINEDTGLPQFSLGDLLKGILTIGGGIIGGIIGMSPVGAMIGAGAGNLIYNIGHNIYYSDEPDKQLSLGEILGEGVLSGGLGYLGGALSGAGSLGSALDIGKSVVTNPAFYIPTALGAVSKEYFGNERIDRNNMTNFQKQQEEKYNQEKSDYDRIMAERLAIQRNEHELAKQKYENYENRLREHELKKQSALDKYYRDMENYRITENKRIEDYNRKREEERLEKIQAEKDYLNRREKEYNDYITRYYHNPNVTSLNKFLKLPKPNYLEKLYRDDSGNVLGKAYALKPNDSRHYFKDGGVVQEKEPIQKNKGIDGEFKGQDDNIYVKVPANSYVVDAQTVSFLGDGNSDAGINELISFCKEIIKKMPEAYQKYKKIPKRYINCGLSSKEFTIMPEIVQTIGDGNIKAGHKIIRAGIEEIRKHKGIKPKTIPPKAKSMTHYVKMKAI